MSTPGVKVLDKALLILSRFFDRDELTIKELEELTRLNRSTIYRILQVFLKWDFLSQDPVSKRYKLSIKILEMSGSVLRKISFLNVCRPYLLNLRDATGESAFLSLLDGENIVVVDWEPSYYNAQINVTVGKTVLAFCTGAGRAMLAFLPQEELEALMENLHIPKYTENTIVDNTVLRDMLKETARKGYAVSRGEYDTHIVVVGAPIFDFRHRVIASCSIAALKDRVKDAGRIEHIGGLVKEASQEISRKLGASMNGSVKDAVNL